MDGMVTRRSWLGGLLALVPGVGLLARRRAPVPDFTPEFLRHIPGVKVIPFKATNLGNGWMRYDYRPVPDGQTAMRHVGPAGGMAGPSGGQIMHVTVTTVHGPGRPS